MTTVLRGCRARNRSRYSVPNWYPSTTAISERQSRRINASSLLISTTLISRPCRMARVSARISRHKRQPGHPPKAARRPKPDSATYVHAPPGPTRRPEKRPWVMRSPNHLVSQDRFEQAFVAHDPLIDLQQRWLSRKELDDLCNEKRFTVGPLQTFKQRLQEQ